MSFSSIPTLLLLRKRLNLIIGIVLLSYIFFGLYISCFPLKYMATAGIAYFPKAYDIQTIENVINEEIIDSTIITEEKAIILSDGLLLTAAKYLNLKNEYEYNPEIKPSKIINILIEKIGNLFKKENLNPDKQLLIKLKSNIKINFIPYSEIKISATSISPKLATSIANTIAKIYNEMPSQNGRKKISNIASIPSNAHLKEYYYKAILTGIFSALFGAILALKLPVKKNLGIYGL